MTAEPTGPPPWWRYYEPPRWFPAWLHRLACTHCRGLNRYGRQQLRAARRDREARHD
jgi:hypothetical protein